MLEPTRRGTKLPLAAGDPMAAFGLHSLDRGGASPPELLLTSVLSRLRDTNSGQGAAILRILKVGQLGDIT